MQHVWNFLCEPKGEPGMVAPESINRMFVSQTSRKNKVAVQIKKAIEVNFGIKEDQIENLYLAQVR